MGGIRDRQIGTGVGLPNSNPVFFSQLSLHQYAVFWSVTLFRGTSRRNLNVKFRIRAGRKHQILLVVYFNNEDLVG